MRKGHLFVFLPSLPLPTPSCWLVQLSDSGYTQRCRLEPGLGLAQSNPFVASQLLNLAWCHFNSHSTLPHWHFLLVFLFNFSATAVPSKHNLFYSTVIQSVPNNIGYYRWAATHNHSKRRLVTWLPNSTAGAEFNWNSAKHRSQTKMGVSECKSLNLNSHTFWL